MNPDFQSRLRQHVFSPFRRTRNALESVAGDGVEREYVFFGKLEHPEQLNNAQYFEDQEQWRMVVPCKEPNREMVMRVRKATRYVVHGNGEASAKDPEYTLTIKTFIKGEPGTVEVEQSIGAKEGELLLPIFRASGDGMVKRRYFFRVDNPSGVSRPDGDPYWWEVDAFFDTERMAKEGAGEQVSMDRFHPYVKLDLEVANFDLVVTEDPKEPGEYVSFEWPFPVELNDVVYSQPHNRSARDAARVEEIMTKYMRAKP